MDTNNQLVTNVTYYDCNMVVQPKDKATIVIVSEYDKNGDLVQETIYTRK